MVGKVVRLSKALIAESIKRLPYVLFMLVVLWGISSYIQFHRTTQNIQATKELTQQVIKISEQNRQLSEQNHALAVELTQDAKDIQAHEDCLVNLFKQPERPVPQIISTDTCAMASLHAETGATTSQGVAQQAPQGQSGSTVSSSNSNAAPSTAQSNSSQLQPSLAGQLGHDVSGIIRAINPFN